MKYLYTILFLLFALLIQAQNPVHFQTINAAGVVHGKNGTELLVQSVNGARFGTWFTGLGVGIDWYYFRSVPLFLSVRKDFLQKSSTPFAYLDLGANFFWDDAYDDYKLPDGSPMFHHYPGFYYDAGFGYSGSDGGRLAAFFTIGFCQKNIKEKERSFWGSPDDFIITRYMLRRLSLKAGLSF